MSTDRDPLLIRRINEPIVLDGIPDEAAWKTIDPLPVQMFVPDFGAEPSQRTEFRIAHDGENVYFSCRNFDARPGLIQSLSLERDLVGWSSDNCGIFLDTFNDEENALAFVAWQPGNRTDFTITNDGQGRVNTNWDGFWDVATSIDPDGWHAEFRIPFSSLLFQPEDGEVVMGMAAMRNFARNSERVTHPDTPPRWGMFSFAKPSRMRKITFGGQVAAVDPVYISPYMLAGTGHSHVLDDVGANYRRESREALDLGLDLRYGVTSNLNLDLTYNTDFAQVEADDQVVNLTRFSLFFPEKRRFFQERASAFEYSLGGQERLFHTRRVGLARGVPVPVYGGARLAGRVGEWDVGLLNMQTEPSEALPSENQGVVRLRRRVFNPNSHVGGIVTSRVGTSGRYNMVYGADALLRIVGNDYLTVNWAQSFDEQEEVLTPKPIHVFDRSLFRLNWERRGEDYLHYAFDLTRTGAAFEPGMGFLQRRNYTKAQATLGYGWRPGVESSLLTYSLNMDGTVFRRNEDQTVETSQVLLAGAVETKTAQRLTLTVPIRYENVVQSFPLSSDAQVPQGVYRFATARLEYRSSQRNEFRPSMTVEAGRFFDGRQTSFSFDPTWTPSRHVSLGGTYRLDRVEFATRNENFTAHVGRLRTQIMYSSATSFLGLVQYNSTDDSVILNFRIRYNPREGNDLYIVWNEGLVTDRFELDPVRPLSDRRTITVKYSHTFQLGL